MSLLVPLAVCMTVVTADPPPADVVVTQFRLRHAAAADAVTAVTTYARQQKMDITVTADPATNVVRLGGNAGQQARVVEVLTALDRSPLQVSAQLMFAEVPVGFTASIGLAAGDEAQWVLTPREAKLLLASVSRAIRAKEIDMMSRPQLVISDNQTGFFEVGDGTHGLVARITPRIVPDEAKILLRLETQITVPNSAAGAVGQDIQSLQTTCMIPAGGMLVVRGPQRVPAGHAARELLVIATATVMPTELTLARRYTVAVGATVLPAR